MRKAVQHRFILGNPPHRPAVVFLIQKKSGFLSAYIIDLIGNAVLHDFRFSGKVGCKALARKKSGVFLHPFQTPYGHIVPLVQGKNLFAHFPQFGNDAVVDPFFSSVHAQGKALGHQNVPVAVHRQPRQAVGLAKDYPAGVVKAQPLAVFPGLRQTAAVYLSQYETQKQPRFDVIEIYADADTPRRQRRINQIENAFE